MMQERIADSTQKFLTFSKRLLLSIRQAFIKLYALWNKIPLSPFQWLLIVYVIFALIFMWATPALEAGDELKHFALIEHIAGSGEYPVQTVGEAGEWREVGNNPPLYYLLGSFIASSIGIGENEPYRIYNPYAQIADPSEVGNKNLLLHDPLNELPQNVHLAVTVLRLMSIVFGVGVLYAVHESARIIAPHRSSVAFLAALLTALNPMFLFYSAAVNPIMLSACLLSFAILLLLHTLNKGFSFIRSFLIAALIALALFVGNSALLLWVAAIFVGIWVGYRRHEWRNAGILAGILGLAFIIVALTWYSRNIGLYGDPLGVGIQSEIANSQPLFARGFEGYRSSFWGLFGVSNIEADNLFYILMDLVFFVGLFGVVWLILQLFAIRDFAYARRELTSIVFLGIVGILALFLGSAVWAQIIGQEGWVVFPYIATITPLLAVGLIEVTWWLIFWLTPPDRSFVRDGNPVSDDTVRRSIRFPAAFFAFLVLLIPIAIIRPQYEPLTPTQSLPEDIREVYANYGDVELLGYRVPERRYGIGQLVPVTLYWRPLAQTAEDHNLSIGLFQVDDENAYEVGKIDTYPGSGKIRTTSWETDKIYADQYFVPISRTVTGSFPLFVQVGWRDHLTQTIQEPSDENGRTLDSVMLEAGAVIGTDFTTSPRVFPLESETVEFDQIIRLADRNFLPESDKIIIHWDTTQPLPKDYVSFVQVLDEEGRLVGQSDVAPDLPTRFWTNGETHYITYSIHYPQPLEPGNYSVITGWYDPVTLERMVVTVTPQVCGLLNPCPDELDPLLATETIEGEFPVTPVIVDEIPEDSDNIDEIQVLDHYQLFAFSLNEDGTVHVQVLDDQKAEQMAIDLTNTAESLPPEQQISPEPPEADFSDDMN